MRLALKDVHLAYLAGTPMEVRALSGLSLAIASGERLGIVGPVGAGKSSLLGVLAGLVAPDRGQVLHDGQEVGAGKSAAPGKVGLALQSPERCLFGRTVLEDVAFAPRQAGVTAEEAGRRAGAALAAVGLPAAAFGGRSPFSLSTGEQRRAALAGVLAMEPKALLLDEPTAFLDPASRSDLTGRLLRLNREQGITLVVVSHDMDEIARLAGRVVVIDEGGVAAEGPASDVLGDASLLVRHSLRPPAVTQIALMLAERTGAAPAGLLDEASLADLLFRAAGGAPDGQVPGRDFPSGSDSPAPGHGEPEAPA